MLHKAKTPSIMIDSKSYSLQYGPGLDMDKNKA
jgi:hypothetical protein